MKPVRCLASGLVSASLLAVAFVIVGALDLDATSAHAFSIASTAGQPDLVEPAAADGFSFGAAVNIVASESDVKAALPIDLDTDGQVDVAYGDGPVLQIAKNTARLGGAWSVTRSVGTAAGDVTSLASGDLNRDGRPDLVTVAGTHVRLWGNPAAAFSQTWVAGTVLTVPVGVQPTAMAVADLDQDGALDIVAGGDDGVVRLWHNPLALQGSLTDTWSTVKELPALASAIAAVGTGDLDRDGRLDLIIVSTGANPTIRLWRNPGAAFSVDWLESVNLSGTLGLSLLAGQHLVVADLDADNCLDVAVGDRGGSVRAWRNPGTAPFGGGWGTGLALGNVGGGLNSISGADLDNDTKLELVGIVSGTLTQVVAWKSGAQPFRTPWTMSLIGTDATPVVGAWSADLDHDGDLDIVTSGHGGTKAWPNQLGPWAVGFKSPGHTVGFNNNWTTAMVVADLDGDGYPDLVTGEQDGRIMGWHNNGTPFAAGGWTGYQMAGATPGELLTLAAGDLDNDGDVDLVAGYYDSGLIIGENNGHPFDGEWSWRKIGIQRVGALELADVDGDGRLDIIAGGGLPWGNTPSEDHRVTVWHAPAAPFSGTWQAADVGRAYYSVLSLAVGDLDNDGDNDIVIGTYHAPPVGDVHHPVPRDQWTDVYQIRAFRNDGGDHWTEFNIGRDPEIQTLELFYHGFWGATVTDVVLADLDTDGDLDIVATESIEGDFLVMGWHNDGTPFSGELWAPSAVAKGERYNWLLADMRWLEAEDLDRDGDLDLVVGSGKQEPHQVMVWENRGVAFGVVISDTAWVRHNVGALGEETRTGGVVDLDRDGHPDLIATAFVSGMNEVRVWRNYVAPNIALDIVPARQTVTPGQMAIYTAVVTGLYGFDQPVNLWVSGLPAGVEATWSRTSLTPPSSSVLTLTLPHDSLQRDYSLLAVALGGGALQTVPFTLTVGWAYQAYLPLVARSR